MNACNDDLPVQNAEKIVYWLFEVKILRAVGDN